MTDNPDQPYTTMGDAVHFQKNAIVSEMWRIFKRERESLNGFKADLLLYDWMTDEMFDHADRRQFAQLIGMSFKEYCGYFSPPSKIVLGDGSQPQQPVLTNENGTKWFKPNLLIVRLRDRVGKTLGIAEGYPLADRQQYFQLSGFTLDNYKDWFPDAVVVENPPQVDSAALRESLLPMVRMVYGDEVYRFAKEKLQ